MNKLAQVCPGVLWQCLLSVAKSNSLGFKLCGYFESSGPREGGGEGRGWCCNCVVLRNIHTPPPWKVFTLNPHSPPALWKFQFSFILSLNKFGLWDPHSLGISNYHPCGWYYGCFSGTTHWSKWRLQRREKRKTLIIWDATSTCLSWLPYGTALFDVENNQIIILSCISHQLYSFGHLKT